MVDNLTEQVVSRVPAKDAVVTVGIDQLPEILVGLHQCLHIFCRIPIVHIVVSKSVTEQQRATQLRRSGDGVHLVVASLVLIGSPLEAPARRRSNRHTSLEHRPSLRHRHQRVPATIRPAPDADPFLIDIRLTA